RPDRRGRAPRRRRGARRAAGRLGRPRPPGRPGCRRLPPARHRDARRRTVAHAAARRLMLRLYLPGVRAGATRVRIAGPEFRHLRALRLAPGARLRVLGADGLEHDVVLERVGAREAAGLVVASASPVRESPLALVLAPALLKGTEEDLGGG